METKLAEIPKELWQQVEPLLPAPTKGANRRNRIEMFSPFMRRTPRAIPDK